MSFIQKLNNIKVEDLKNIDFKKLFVDLKNKPILLINIGIALITALTCITLVNQRVKETKNVRKQIYELKLKIEAIESFTVADTALKKLINEIPTEISANNFVDLITDFAKSHSIQIKSFAPIQTNQLALHNEFKTSLEISSDDYKKVWLFARALESAPQHITIDRWSAISTTRKASRPSYSRGRPQSMDEQDGSLNLTITMDIKLISLKNDKKS